VKALPSNQAFWKEIEPKGVHMFMVHGQDEDKDWMENYAKARGLTFPIAMQGECDFEKYDGGVRNHIPYAYVIGPDGKVVWQGEKGYEAQVRAQLARIKYPKLRRMDVAPEVVAAATAFEAGEIADAREAAIKVRDAAAEETPARTDAEYVIEKIDAHLAELRTRIDELKAARRYHEVLPLLEQLSGAAYKGLPQSDEAATELKALKADKAVKEELKAWEQLAKMLEGNAKAKTDADRRKNIEKFVKKYEGTAAAEEAAAMLEPKEEAE
jgi:hypothetical protein